MGTGPVGRAHPLLLPIYLLWPLQNPIPTQKGGRRGQGLAMDSQGWTCGQKEKVIPKDLLGVPKAHSLLKGSRSKTSSTRLGIRAHKTDLG